LSAALSNSITENKTGGNELNGWQDRHTPGGTWH
jgi:hypothetical protein